jgi:hypothetical protein
MASSILLMQTGGDQVINSATETATDSVNALTASFAGAMNQVIGLAPKLVAMAVVLVIGFIIARVVAGLVAKVSERIGLQTAAEKGGVVDSMKHMGIERTVPQIVGTIVFWLLMCVFLMASFNILGLTTVTVALERVVAYIPKVLVATVVIVVGLLVASFLKGIIATSADRVGISYAQQLATGCYYVLAGLVFIGAFEQLEIKFELLNYAVLIAFTALSLGFALAFGLGGREVMGGILAGYYVRQRMQAGDHVNVAGLEGTVRDVGPVATLVETEEDGLMHRHSIPNGKMLSEAVR